MNATTSLPSVPYVVYALVDPRDDTIRYIGQTDNLLRRICEHLSLRGHNVRLNAWLCTMALAGHAPIIKTLEIVAAREIAIIRERHLIDVHIETIYNIG